MTTSNPTQKLSGGRVGPWLLAILLGAGGWQAAAAQPKPLGLATVTEVKNDVRYKAADADERPAKQKDVVRGADVLRTGAKSLAEIEFEDKTITRLGSNSKFSFDPDKREMELHSGVMLFDMKKGLGGGRIKTAGLTAAIEGTAGIVHKANQQVICLAGLIRILDALGKELALLKPGETWLNNRVFPISLRALKSGKLLLNGLPHSGGEFDAALVIQEKQLADGTLAPLDQTGEMGQEMNNPGQPFATGIQALTGGKKQPPPPSGHYYYYYHPGP